MAASTQRLEVRYSVRCYNTAWVDVPTDVDPGDDDQVRPFLDAVDGPFSEDDEVHIDAVHVLDADGQIVRKRVSA